MIRSAREPVSPVLLHPEPPFLLPPRSAGLRPLIRVNPDVLWRCGVGHRQRARTAVLDEVQARSLKTSLELTNIGDAWSDGARTAATLLDRNVQLALSDGLWLKRSRVMDRWRLEVVGGRTDRDALVALGCFVEIIAFTQRVFVPIERPEIVEAVLRRHPVQHVLDGAAA